MICRTCKLEIEQFENHWSWSENNVIISEHLGTCATKEVKELKKKLRTEA